MNRKITVTLAAAAAVAGLAGCGQTLTAGHVAAKQYQPAYYWIYEQPVFITTCDTVGSTEDCITSVSTWIPVQEWQPPDWRLLLHAGKKQGWTYVSQAQYDRARLGQWWGSRNAARPAAVKAPGHKAPGQPGA